jgi:hypothetical protein
MKKNSIVKWTRRAGKTSIRIPDLIGGGVVIECLPGANMEVIKELVKEITEGATRGKLEKIHRGAERRQERLEKEKIK